MAELDTEINTFEERRHELLGTARGKFVLIRGTDVAGTYDTQADAIKDGYRRYGNVPFLVKRISEVDAVQNFASNLLEV